MYLISPQKQQFKANLHCHSTYSDGKLTPQQLKDAYKEHGYQVLCISDHERTHDLSEMSDPDFLMLTGYEAYIRPNYAYNFYDREVHLNLFARDPRNEALVCYNPRSCKYLTPEEQAAIPKAGPLAERAYTVEYINDFIRIARENGYIVAYNHPVWSGESFDRIASYEGLFSMELCNYSSASLGNPEYSGPLYNQMLRQGYRLFAHSADDNHNEYPFDSEKNDSFGGITMILADKLEYDEVFHAMETGEMYSTMGPVFHEVSFDGEQVHIRCSDVAQICCNWGGKTPTCVRAKQGQTICEATIPLKENARFVQVSILDRSGNFADTRGYFRDELGLPPLENA
jgi:hypothetical protein